MTRFHEFPWLILATGSNSVVFTFDLLAVRFPDCGSPDR